MPADLFVFRYGNYQHQPGEVRLDDVSVDVQWNDGGQAWARTERWTLGGELVGNTTDELTLQILRMVAGYSLQGQSAGFFKGTGGGTAHILLSDGALGGVRVIKAPSFPKGDQTEYISIRSYQIVLEATFVDPNIQLLRFQESLQTQAPGGPLYGHSAPIIEIPRKYITRLYTPCRVIQVGSATGLFDWPKPPPPIWPSALFENPPPNKHSPRRYGRPGQPSWTEYQIDWQYVFEAVTPLIGVPNRWI